MTKDGAHETRKQTIMVTIDLAWTGATKNSTMEGAMRTGGEL